MDYRVTTTDGSMREPIGGNESKESRVLFRLDRGTKVEILAPEDRRKLKPEVLTHTYIRVIVRKGSHKGGRGWFREDHLAADPTPFG